MRTLTRTLILLLALYCIHPIHLEAKGNEAIPARVPQFTLNDINNNEISLEKYRGMVVMINFWATWCPPCVEELPAMQALRESFSDKPFEILAVNMGETVPSIKAFTQKLGINFSFPLLVDPDSSVATMYQVTSLPATLLVDRNGFYAFGGVGPRNWNSTEVRNEILPLFED